jgi:hypothetical protein
LKINILTIFDCISRDGFAESAGKCGRGSPTFASGCAAVHIFSQAVYSKQRPAQYIFSAEVQKRLSEIRKDEAAAAQEKAARKASTAA